MGIEFAEKVRAELTLLPRHWALPAPSKSEADHRRGSCLISMSHHFHGRPR